MYERCIAGSMIVKKKHLLPALSCLLAMATAIAGASEVNEPDPTLTATTASSPRMSPDGRWVVFETRSTDGIQQNAWRTRAWLAPVEDLRSAGFIEIPVAGASWSPDSRRLAFRTARGIETYDIASATMQLILEAGRDKKRIFGASAGIRWSPDGRFLAFLQPQPDVAPAPDLNRGVELDIDWDPVRDPGQRITLMPVSRAPALLWIAEVATGKLIRLTPPNHDVYDYAWSPDSRRLAYSAIDNPKLDSSVFLDADLFVIDREQTGTFTANSGLVRQPGGDLSPVWSPDGRWIAFESLAGRDVLRGSERQLAIVPVDGSAPPVYPTSKWLEGMSFRPMGIHWMSDSETVLLNVFSEMRGRLVRVSRVAGSSRPEFLGSDALQIARDFSFDAGVRQAAFIMETPTHAPRLCLFRSASREVSCPMPSNDAGTQRQSPIAEEVVYRSFDDKWDIHGIVLKPAAFDPRKKYPLLVVLRGGPSQVVARFGLDPQFPVLSFANRGYVVFMPNTRGRDGYGAGFAAAIETERSNASRPYRDVMSGVDALIARGYIDSERMGIMGFSYGCVLAAYTIAQSHRFKAASLADGWMEMTSSALASAGLGWSNTVLLQQNGIGDIYDPAERRRAEEEWAIGHIERVRTPSLILAGVDSTATVNGRMFLHAFRRFGVPAEFIVFPRTGHGIREPLLLHDSHERNLEWFDYWVRGITTERMLRRYGRRL